MGVSVVGGSTSSGASLTPFDAPFNYNFSSSVEGTFVNLDLGSNIPAGTYLFSGKARGYAPPRTIQVLNSSGTVVGTGTTTVNQGTWNNTNSSSYTCNLTATNSFSRIRFTGSSSGSRVAFDSTAPTVPDYHLTISAGTRDVARTTFPEKLFTDTAKSTINNAPAALPTNQYALSGLGWYFNNKWYQMTQSAPSLSAPNGTTNTIRVIVWDYATSSWSTLFSTNPSSIGLNTFAIFGGNGVYNRYWLFKNGRVVITHDYLYNTNGSTTAERATNAWSIDLNSGSFSSVSIPTQNMLTVGASCYNPTNDEWFHIGATNTSLGGASSRIARIQNNGTIQGMSTTNTNYYEGAGIFVQDAATPKINTAYVDGSGTLYAGYFASWSNGGNQTFDYTTNSGNLTAYTPIFEAAEKRGVITTFNGISGYYLSVERIGSNQKWVGGAYEFSNTQAGAAQLGPHSTMFFLGDSDGGGYQYQISPINSTQVGVVRFRSTYGSGATIGAQIVVLPSSVTYP